MEAEILRVRPILGDLYAFGGLRGFCDAVSVEASNRAPMARLVSVELEPSTGDVVARGAFPAALPIRGASR